MVDEFFAREIDIVENGISQRVTNFEIIVLQLWIKAMAGNKRALNVLLKYRISRQVVALWAAWGLSWL